MCQFPLVAIQESKGEKIKILAPLAQMCYIYRRFRAIENFILIPCGKCLDCRMARARDWSLRASHELKLCNLGSDSPYNSCFITLTYDDDHLPMTELAKYSHPFTLCRDDYQKFFKRLRQKLAPQKIRYFGCGEYGLASFRPHYHFIIFGWFPSDVYPWSLSGDNMLYRSPLLESCWPLGISTVGMVTHDSINYVARYASKKLEQDTSMVEVQPFVVSSNRPGLGSAFFTKFRSDFIKFDEDHNLALASCKDGDILFSLPRYYRKVLRKSDSDLADLVDSLYMDKSCEKVITREDLIRRCEYNAVRSEKFRRNNSN